MPALKKWIAAQSTEVILNLASDYATLPKVLELILEDEAHAKNQQVLEAIASNINTAPQTLDYMANVYYQTGIDLKVMENPATPLSWIQEAAQGGQQVSEQAVKLANEIINTWTVCEHQADSYEYKLQQNGKDLCCLAINYQNEVFFVYKGEFFHTESGGKIEDRIRYKAMRKVIAAFKCWCKNHPGVQLKCLPFDDERYDDRVRFYKKLGFSSLETYGVMTMFT